MHAVHLPVQRIKFDVAKKWTKENCIAEANPTKGPHQKALEVAMALDWVWEASAA